MLLGHTSEFRPIYHLDFKNFQSCFRSNEKYQNQLLQLCTAGTVFSILVTVRLYTVMPEVCHWLTNEKQKKTDILLLPNN